ncbi:hypothetical protein O6H91_02G063100 [Diphasiastrum complanatum]|uniref:Uncharacterized protein n=3 Tax=Diphasiastrum complanatum TaxID=34168 RepID=A0ACC2EGB1_DIPCM|nr:hypothetical protein O6H91_02G063100 [Diphasiastrum complanatum]KAJ7565491.1 hypothetical protein O6H91_02G063100 [Diphasiastrum complanatum]KAJ7565492.1 hypothetical protein O6H91_02G063100 [Diphasiastrum complanatum]
MSLARSKMPGTAAKRRSFQSWVTLPSAPPKEGFLTNFGVLEPTIADLTAGSPTTTLSIGVESLGDRENAKDLSQQPVSKLKSVSWAHLKEKTSSVCKGGDLGGLQHDRFVSGEKRKRAVSFDPKGRTELGEIPFQEESDIELALGQMGGCSQSKSKSGAEIFTGEPLGGLNMALGNCQLENYYQNIGGSGREELVDAVSQPRSGSGLAQWTAGEDSQHLDRATFDVANKNFSEESNLLLSLGDMGHANGSREDCDFSSYTSKHLQDERLESSAEVPLGLGLFGNPIQNLSVGESRSFSGLRDVEDHAGDFLGLGQTNHQPETVCEQVLRPRRIPIVDEGSSSARWLKSGGFMPSLLMSSRMYREFQNTTAVDCLENNGVLANHEEELVEPDFSVIVRPSSGTTSTSGASGLSDRASKICKFRGCGKGARGASGLCIAHGGGRRCQKHGCNKGAEGRTVYCKAHGGGRRCQSLGCTKSAEGKTDYCIGHGGGRRCSHESCVKAARGKSGLCIRHGGGKRCQKEGCTKSAEGYTGLCISHGGGRRCQFAGCTKGAQGSTMFCKAHGGGKRCMILGCNKGAEGSTPLCKGHGGGKRCMYEGGGICTKSVHGGTLFCVAHGGGKRCAVSGCSKSARGRTDFCVRHGGGKRCKVEACGKSAQGSTDFCKAHGGGKRCSWGQEGSAYEPSLIIEGNGELSRTACDRFARGRLGLCAAHGALLQDQRVNGKTVGASSFGPGLTPGLFRGLVSGSVQNTVSKGTPLSSTVGLSTHDNSHVFTNDKNSAGTERLEGLDSGEMWKRSNSMIIGSTVATARPVEASQGLGISLGGESVQNKVPGGSFLDPSGSVHGDEKYLPGLGSPLQFAFEWATAPRSSSLGRCGSSSNAPEIIAINIVPSASVSILQSFHQSLIPPQVLVPQSMKQSVHSSSNLFEGDSGGVGSSFMPEGRVHGGGLLAMLASEATEKEDA